MAATKKQIKDNYLNLVNSVGFVYEITQSVGNGAKLEQATTALVENLKYFMADRENVQHAVCDPHYRELTYVGIKNNKGKDYNHYDSIQMVMLLSIGAIKNNNPELAIESLSKITGMGHASLAISALHTRDGIHYDMRAPEPVFRGWMPAYVNEISKLMLENKGNAKVVEAAGSLLLAYADKEKLHELEDRLIPSSQKYNDKNNYDGDKKIIEKLDMLASQPDQEIAKFSARLLLQRDVLHYSHNLDTKYINHNVSFNNRREDVKYSDHIQNSTIPDIFHIIEKADATATPEQKSMYSLAAFEMLKYRDSYADRASHIDNKLIEYCLKNGSEEIKDVAAQRALLKYQYSPEKEIKFSPRDYSRNEYKGIEEDSSRYKELKAVVEKRVESIKPGSHEKKLSYINNNEGYLSFEQLKELEIPGSKMEASGATSPVTSKKYPGAHAI